MGDDEVSGQSYRSNRNSGKSPVKSFSANPSSSSTINLDEIFERSFHFFMMHNLRHTIFAQTLMNSPKINLSTEKENILRLINCLDKIESKYRGFMMNLVLQLFEQSAQPNSNNYNLDSKQKNKKKTESDILISLISQCGDVYKTIDKNQIPVPNQLSSASDNKAMKNFLQEIKKYSEASMKFCSRLPFKGGEDCKKFGESISHLINLLKTKNINPSIASKIRTQNKVIIALLRKIRSELSEDDADPVNNKALEMILALLYILLEIYRSINLY